MPRISSISVKGLRTLANVTNPGVEIKPITVLVGRNSVGKSTFGRILPLLRQSAERKKRSPILWFDDLVDFGSFDEAVTHGQSCVELSLKLTGIEEQRSRTVEFAWGDFQAPNKLDFQEAEVCIKLIRAPDDGGTTLQQISVSVAGAKAAIHITNNSVTEIIIGSRSFKPQNEKFKIITDQGSILPKLRFLEKRKADEPGFYLTRNYWRNSAADFIHSQVHGNTSRGKTTQIAARLPFAEEEALSKAIQGAAGPASWEYVKPNFLRPTSWSRKELVDRLLIANIDHILERIDDALASCVKGVRYLKPLRATAERYYRRADLAVSDIDPEGRNLAIFLDALPPWQLSEFQGWLKENFSFEIHPKRVGAQLALMARGRDDAELSNIADMGFGISQVLPIAAQLWAASFAIPTSIPSSTHSLIVIEQPELHLHPAFQARLADVFASVARPTQESIFTKSATIVIETHSQQIVNQLGNLIERGRLKASDVSIVLFEPHPTIKGTTEVRVAEFNEDGILTNWPFGFFEPDDE